MLRPGKYVVPALVPTVVFLALLSHGNVTRDPAELDLDQLFAKSDCVVFGKINQIAKSKKFQDLDSRYFDEYVVTIEVWGVLKGSVKRRSELNVVAYKSNGRGMPGNFGSTMRLFDQEYLDKSFRGLHLLYLCRRDETWMPTSGYLDGGNSHFLAIPSGFVRP